MARNRKRAKERRDRRPQTVGSRSSLGGRAPLGDPPPIDERVPSPLDHEVEGMPTPLEHASPDVELADAQLAIGAIESMEEEPVGADGEELETTGDGGGGDGVRIGSGFGDDGDGGEPPSGGAGEVALPQPGAAAEPRGRHRNRVLNFLEGSWRELQRVQWPDRRQVLQATAVVLGFVIAAGLLLAVADTLSSHLMSYILTGVHSVLAWVAIAVIVGSLAVWMLADRDR
jgi:preprotein translocase SecE subunit